MKSCTVGSLYIKGKPYLRTMLIMWNAINRVLLTGNPVESIRRVNWLVEIMYMLFLFNHAKEANPVGSSVSQFSHVTIWRGWGVLKKTQQRPNPFNLVPCVLMGDLIMVCLS